MTGWWPLIAIAGVFVLGGLAAWGIDRYGRVAEAKGRVDGENEALLRGKKADEDVMAKQDELASVAAQRNTDGDISRRMRDGTF